MTTNGAEENGRSRPYLSLPACCHVNVSEESISKKEKAKPPQAGSSSHHLQQDRSAVSKDQKSVNQLVDDMFSSVWP
ncbi:conserved hypothetical protein [Ricinus communis]|uniref:Uncharacterized protein n=1 Tax=Ricinus communis TaxID=3988 RepID=B9S1Z1_RICCO|nr:conserved hypothetical protein [Ricinus communis]